MIAICNGVDLSAYIGQGFSLEYEPQYSASMTAMDGTDYTAKLRDRVKLAVPFIPLTLEQLTEVLQLFPQSGAYVTWQYYDPFTGGSRIIQAKYETRSSNLVRAFRNGKEYWSGLVVKLIER